jgi:hypothetical protein
MQTWQDGLKSFTNLTAVFSGHWIDPALDGGWYWQRNFPQSSSARGQRRVGALRELAAARLGHAMWRDPCEWRRRLGTPHDSALPRGPGSTGGGVLRTFDHLRQVVWRRGGRTGGRSDSTLQPGFSRRPAGCMPHSRWPANPGTSPCPPSCRRALFGNQEHLALALHPALDVCPATRHHRVFRLCFVPDITHMTRTTGFPLPRHHPSGLGPGSRRFPCPRAEPNPFRNW